MDPVDQAHAALRPISIGIVSTVIYVLPILVAYKRGHRERRMIAILDLAAGWTIIGWLIALVWACRDRSFVPPPRTIIDAGTKTCPDCAEPVKRAAVKCRYCGYRFDGAPPTPDAPVGPPDERRPGD